MEHATQPHSVNPVDSSAFAEWLRRTLKACHEDAMHEPIPHELLELLPPPTEH